MPALDDNVSHVVLLQRVMRGHLTRKKLNEALKLYEEVCIELNDDGPHPFQLPLSRKPAIECPLKIDSPLTKIVNQVSTETQTDINEDSVSSVTPRCDSGTPTFEIMKNHLTSSSDMGVSVRPLGSDVKGSECNMMERQITIPDTRLAMASAGNTHCVTLHTQTAPDCQQEDVSDNSHLKFDTVKNVIHPEPKAVEKYVRRGLDIAKKRPRTNQPAENGFHETPQSTRLRGNNLQTTLVTTQAVAPEQHYTPFNTVQVADTDMHLGASASHLSDSENSGAQTHQINHQKISDAMSVEVQRQDMPDGPADINLNESSYLTQVTPLNSPATKVTHDHVASTPSGTGAMTSLLSNMSKVSPCKQQTEYLLAEDRPELATDNDNTKTADETSMWQETQNHGASSPSREPDPGPTISTASELSQVWVSADPTHFDLKRMRDEAAMELVWLEQAITSRKQASPEEHKNSN